MRDRSRKQCFSGNLAIWADGPRVEWNAKKMEVKGHPEYNELIRPKFRDGWTVSRVKNWFRVAVSPRFPYLPGCASLLTP